MLRILIDLDGVVCDLLTPWCAEYNRRYDDNLTVDQFAASWQVHDNVKCGDKIYDIFEEEGFFRDLPFMPLAYDAMRELHNLEKLGLIECYIVSDCSGNATIAKDKFLWIQKYMPWFDCDRVILTAAKHLVSGDVLIEDSPKKLLKWTAAQGHEILHFLMPAPHNKEVSGDFHRVSSWDQIMKELRGALQ